MGEHRSNLDLTVRMSYICALRMVTGLSGHRHSESAQTSKDLALDVSRRSGKQSGTKSLLVHQLHSSQSICGLLKQYYLKHPRY